jgi:leader peptidase (prepilin peptidase)/N-methyltransferase
MEYWFAWLWAVVASPFIGSFLGVLIWRLPVGAPVVISRSACDHCGAVLSARDLVPLASWLLLKGRCRHCGAPLGAFYPGVEVAAFGVAVWAVIALPGPYVVLAGCLLGWALLGASIIDARHLLLPDVLVLPLIPLGILFHAAVAPASWPDHIIGAVAGFVLFAAVAALYHRLRGREGLGLGDAKLLAAAGAWVGWAGLPSVVFLGALFGLATALVLRAMGRKLERATELPFGPALALAFWLVWVYGPLVPV